jgi:hypothetical protein
MRHRFNTVRPRKPRKTLGGLETIPPWRRPDPPGPSSPGFYPAAPPSRHIPARFQGVLAEGAITDANVVGPLAGQGVAALVAAIRAGSAYANVHTVRFPPGEIRGPDRLSGAPAPSPGSHSALRFATAVGSRRVPPHVLVVPYATACSRFVLREDQHEPTLPSSSSSAGARRGRP